MGSVVTIGVFDGVHRGHQGLVAETVARAAATGQQCVVVTFHPNPIEVLRPDRAPTRLGTLEQRVELLRELGVDHVEVVTFDQQLSRMSAPDFTSSVLLERLQASTVVIGAGFRFGNKAAGTVATLREAGLEVVEFELLPEAGQAVSSSRIRAAIADGGVELAASMLGRRHCLAGRVVQGHRRGRELGYPTANVAVDTRMAIPADGVYAGIVHWHGEERLAAISVGTNPTFGQAERTVEAYLLDFDGDLYGQELTVEFAHRLRPMLAFSSLAELIDAMREDVSNTRKLMSA